MDLTEDEKADIEAIAERCYQDYLSAGKAEMFNKAEFIAKLSAMQTGGHAFNLPQFRAADSGFSNDCFGIQNHYDLKTNTYNTRWALCYRL